MPTRSNENTLFVLKQHSQFYVEGDRQQWQITEGLLYVKQCLRREKQIRGGPANASAWTVVDSSQANLWRRGKKKILETHTIFANQDQAHPAGEAELITLAKLRERRMHIIPPNF